MKRDDIRVAIETKRAELAALEAEAKTLPFTTDDQKQIKHVSHDINVIYDGLGVHRNETGARGAGETRFKLIDALDTRLQAIERAIFTDDVTDKRTVNDRLAALESVTRMLGETVWSDDLADDAQDPLEAQLDALNAEYVCDLKAKIVNQAATIAKLEDDLEDAAEIASFTAESRLVAHAKIKDQSAKIRVLGETIAKLEADLAAAIIVPEGYEAKPQYSIFSDVPDAIFFEKKEGAK